MCSVPANAGAVDVMDAGIAPLHFPVCIFSNFPAMSIVYL